MTSPTPEDLLPDGLEREIAELLKDAPSGIDEFSLIKHLASCFPESLFAEPDGLRDPLKLFQIHFLLFHVLYRMSDGLAEKGFRLRIGAMRIVVEPLGSGGDALQVSDPLRAYYLDWDQWANTHAEDVERLMDSFWTGRGAVCGAEVDEALRVFELERSATARDIKLRYRALISVHHPDKGGDTAHVQRINQAFVILKRYYGKTGSRQSL